MKFRKLICIAVCAACMGSLTVHAVSDGFTVGEDNWSFGNWSNAFPDDYSLTESDYAVLLQGMSNIEKSESLPVLQNSRIGTCFGIALSNVLGYYGVFSPEQLDTNASCLFDAQANPAIISMMDFYFFRQVSTEINQACAWFLYDYSDEERLQYLINCVKDGQPALLSYRGNFLQSGYEVGHTVVAYDVEYGAYEWEGKSYDGRVLIIDSNVVKFTDKACLYFNSSALSWCIPQYKADSQNGCWLTQVFDDVDLLNVNGLFGGSDYTMERDFITVLKSNALQSGYTLNSIHYADGIWSSQGEAENAKTSMYTADNFSSRSTFLIPDAESGYMLDLKNVQALDAYITYENKRLCAAADSADMVVFAPDGYVAFAGETGEYTLSIIGNEGYYTGSWYEFTVSGNGEAASLQQTEEGYILTADNLQEITVSAKNDTVTAMLSFSADADSVLLYEIDEYTIGAAVDTDGDGSYETTVAESDYFGDVNMDGSVDANDATAILIAAANAAAGEESGLNDNQKIYADVNCDGEFNAVDATLVLQYAAYAGAGGTIGFGDFLRM